MPQEVISIQHFGGMITNPHKEDIPDNMAVYALDIDPQTEIGVLRSVKTKGSSYTANGSTIPDVYEADWILYENSGMKYDLIYLDKNLDDIIAITDFYAAEASRTKSTLGTPTVEPKCLKTFNNAVQIGMGADIDSATPWSSYTPLTVYRLLNNKEFFNGGGSYTVTAGLQIEEAICVNDAGGRAGSFQPTTVTNTGSPGGYFQDGIYYWYLVTIFYDGIQESNLPPVSGGQGILLSGTTSDEMTITIRAKEAQINFDQFDKRITAIKLYRAESSDDQIANLGLFRLVKVIDINTGTDTANWATDGTDHYKIDITDDGSYEDGQTYEEETGLLENLSLPYVHYNINEVGGGYHWMAQCYVPEAGEADFLSYIFRSKKSRPNMVNWASDRLALPEVPKALAYYNDRLYAFTTNTVYKINPELLYIEDTYFGAGAEHKQSVCVSEYGLYFCNVNGAYRIKDGGIEVISDVISETLRTEGYSGFKDFADISYNTSAFGRVVIKAEVDKRLILFLGGGYVNPNSFTKAYGFYIPTGQWYAYSIGSTNATADSGYYNGKDGEIYYSNGSASYRLFDGTTYETSKWISKEFNLNEPSQNKSWNMLKWDATAGTGSVTVKYDAEGANPESGTTATSGSWINIYKKSFQTYLTIAGNAVVDSLDIIVRRLFGRR